MAEPQFDPSQPFTVAPPADAAPPAFDPSQPFEAAAPPTFRTQNETDAAGNPIVRGASHAWDVATTPLLPQIGQAAHAIAEFISQPRQGDAQLNEYLPGLGTLSAQLRGGGAGMIEGAGDMASSFTSLAGIALTLAGAGPGGKAASKIPALKALLELPAVQTLQKAVQGVGGAAFGAHGATRVVTEPTLGGKAQGVVEAASGALGVAGAMRGSSAPAVARPPTPDEAAAAWGAREGIPIDAGTATGNRAIKGVQYMADRTLAGSLVAKGAQQRTTEALAAKGAELADQARGVAVTPEQAGQGIRDALTAKVDAHTALADASYERLRDLEAQPTNRMLFPRPKAPVDAHPAPIVGELRRIVHEMDASGYSPSKLVNLTPGETGGSHYVPRSGGAQVYHDITETLGHTPTRSAIQEELEAYLGGGPKTAAVKAALDVATARAQEGMYPKSVSIPELPKSARDVPTRLEGARVTSDEIGLPVDTRAAKEALRPVYDQMRRQMPVAQQQMNPGLKALENILEGPDWAPLSQVDRDLSAIKAIARKQGGLAKLGAGHLDRAVQEAAGHGGPEVVHALHQGRQATIAKVQTADLVDSLPGGALQEGGAVFARATQPKDGGIEFLRAVQDQTPHAVPQIARALLDDLLAMKPDKMQAEWMKRGKETRAILFPEPGQAAALDHFFRVQKLLNENVNPSGSAAAAMKVAEGATLYANPLAFVATQAGSAGVSALLHSPRGVRALTKLLGGELAAAKAPATARRTTSAARAAAWAEVVSAGKAVDVPLTAPTQTSRPE